MLNPITWWRKLTWKKCKYLLLAKAIIFVLVQLLIVIFLGFTGDGSNTNNVKHQQHVAAKKVFSKWDEPQHSKLLKDPEGHAISLRGTRDKDIMKYFPNSKGKFTCFNTNEEMDFIKVNDDYCDCPYDGSDEPGTNACINGVFYCEKSSHKFPEKIPSYQVNDGVCDCCDGSDEWLEVSVLDVNEVSEDRPLKYRLTHCENYCKHAI